LTIIAFLIVEKSIIILFEAQSRENLFSLNKGSLKLVNLLLERMPSPSVINWQDYEGRTSLHLAVLHTNLGELEYR
jgi:ankyrin repeat protein